MVVGPGGAGKSTLAARIGPLLGLPVIHLDRHLAESRRLVHAAVAAARARDRLVVLGSRRAAARWAESLRPPEAAR
jgi:adenylate kinase family enzyme